MGGGCECEWVICCGETWAPRGGAAVGVLHDEGWVSLKPGMRGLVRTSDPGEKSFNRVWILGLPNPVFAVHLQTTSPMQ